MNKPLFSIIIPTRERHETLSYAMQSVLNQTYDNFELIIMDNFSSEETYQVVHAFKDNRIQYYRSPERLSMQDNWELGLSKTKGEYVFVLGDDDGLIPDAIEIANHLFAFYSSEIVCWNRPQYWWNNPDIPWQSDKLFIHFLPNLNRVELRDTKLFLEMFYDNLYFENLPMIYNSFVSQQVIERIKSKSQGYYFNNIINSCDVYSGILNAYFTTEYIYSYRPLSISGLSPKSNGTSTAYLSKDATERNLFIKESKFDIKNPFHPLLIPSMNQEIGVAATALQTKELFFNQDKRFDLNINNLLTIVASRLNRDPNSYDKVLNDIINLANKHNISLSAVNIPPKIQENPPSLQGIYKNEQGIPTFMAINCEKIGVSNVVQAAKLTQSILPKLEELILSTINSNLVKTSKSSSELKNNQKMKIALDIAVLGLGTIIETAKTGVFRVTEYLLKGLIKSSECQIYLCTSIPNLFDACQTYINKNLLDKNICLFQLSDLQDQDIDVYHSTYYPLPNNIYSATRIITVCDLIPLIFPEYFNHNSDHIIKNTIDSIGRNDLVCCISKSTKQDISNYRTDISQEKLFVTYLAADNNKFYPCNEQKLINQTKEKYNIPDQPYLLSLSTLEPRKNIAHVIHCFLKLIKEQHINDLNLVLVGTKGWQYEEILTEIDENKELQHRIIVTGYVPDEDLAPLYSGASAFLYVSFYEGFGLPPLEAMQCGIPVITSNTSSLPEVIEDAGILLAPQDESGLYDAIFKIYSDPEFRENLATKSVKQSQKFSWDKYIEKTIKVYKLAKEKSKNLPPRNIIIDGVFFQLYKTGIARVWKSLLEQWANTEFADHILVLDRANTAPKINGIRYCTIHPYDYNNTETDKQILQQICDEEEAELFISTYYTTPINTPSVFMAYDMIPEVIGANVSEPMWREKHNGIQHASAFISISENTAKDLNKFFPDISLESITVAHCGVAPLFSPASENEINAFKHKYGINKPYFLLGGLGGYKNTILFFQAFFQLSNKHSFDIVSTGAGNQLPSEWRKFTAGCTFHSLDLSDEELRLAYAGAIALVYPSLYEGFGMPVAEAMACGCPVITTPNASLPEVGGEAVIYVKDDDIEGMANALCDVQRPSLRRNLIQAGLAQAQKFSWSKMADTVSNVLINQTLDNFNLREINLIMFPDWTQSEDDLYLQLGEVIQELANSSDADKTTLLIYAGNTDPETADLLLSSIAMNLMMEYEIDITERMQISLMEEISKKQWQKLLPNLHSRIALEVENQEAIAQYHAETLPDLEMNKVSK